MFIIKYHNNINTNNLKNMKKTFKYFSGKGYKHYTSNTIEELDKLPLDNIDIITEFAHLCEWLRVNHKIHIRVDAWLQEDGSNQGYDFCVYKTWKDKVEYELKILSSSTQIKLYKSPQEAYSAAFDYIKNNNLI